MDGVGRIAAFRGPGQPFELMEFPIPDPEPYAIVVCIHQTNICGSDLHLWRGDGGAPMAPGGRVLGHEMVGEVERLGSRVTTDSVGTPLEVGDRVVYAYFYPCGRCRVCAEGRFSLCQTRLEHYQEPLGTWPYFNGGFADYYYLRERHFVVRVPDELEDDLVAPANCALAQVIHSLSSIGFRGGQTLAVQGAGALGLYAIAVAKSLGAATVVVIDGIGPRLELAGRFGADEVISVAEVPSAQERVELVREATHGGADVVLEAVGIPDVVNEGLEMVAPGGTYLDVGLLSPGYEVTIRPSWLLRRNLSYVGSNHYNPIALQHAVDLLVRTRSEFPYQDIVGAHYSLDRLEEAFQSAEWAGDPNTPPPARVAITPGPQ